MDKEFSNILKRLASQNDTTPEQVYAEMEKAIDVAYANNDQNTMEYRKMMSLGDERPSPEEFIMAMAKDTKRNVGES
ncbi:sporulation initiation factor Spo0A C-terminal domain-containing protein [Aminicella lysinilytica]|uniref:Sporulation initiation factor Spo0A-like protein n=1 Tax=Aminicella lysinilytica TaxID=433323 RepID=A0A4V3CQS4_9FIRM|nr:sporulation initiation factor Spo0A C-terminal domain-containing protein [Aminicella lysinilytica]TDP44669.1 sporulation initiation factor Spo0A-like protein [Aminicella lysinilytica]